MNLWSGKPWNRNTTWINNHEPSVIRNKKNGKEISVLANNVSWDVLIEKGEHGAYEWGENRPAIGVPWQPSSLSIGTFSELGHQQWTPLCIVGGLPKSTEKKWVIYSEPHHCHFCGSAGLSWVLRMHAVGLEPFRNRWVTAAIWKTVKAHPRTFSQSPNDLWQMWITIQIPEKSPYSPAIMLCR